LLRFLPCVAGQQIKKASHPAGFEAAIPKTEKTQSAASLLYYRDDEELMAMCFG